MNELLPGRDAAELTRNPRRLSLKPILITIGVAFLLLAGSLAGALSTCGSLNSSPSPSFKFFTFCVYIFFAIFMLALAWLLLSFIIWLIGALRNSKR